MTTTDCPVDSAKLEELTDLFGDEEEVASLFQEFFEELPEHMEALRQAIQSGSTDGVQSTAHLLKGGSGGLGAQDVSQAACELETSGRSQDLGQADQQLVELETQLERLKGWLGEKGWL